MAEEMPEKRFMEKAIETARKGIEKGQIPFGACVVRKGKMVSCEHSRVWEKTDASAHAEINAIRGACKKIGSVKLSDCEIYSTCEPCPMCFSAIHWARIKRIVFGARIEDAKKAGFNELEIPVKKMKKMGESKIELIEGFMEKECIALFEEWKEKGKSKPY